MKDREYSQSLLDAFSRQNKLIWRKPWLSGPLVHLMFEADQIALS
jgi:hypothetical protein